MNKELWVVLTLFLVCLLLNYVVASQRMVLGFYAFPTLISAYAYGRRHATLTALASVLLVGLMALQNPAILSASAPVSAVWDRWIDILAWGSTLIITGYLMGTLYEHKARQVKELRDTYNGVLLILRHFISNDKYTENHSYRVSVYAARIAAAMGLGEARVEDVRAAALLHDIGKLQISRDLLYKAASLTAEEYGQMQLHVDRGVELLDSVGGSLRRVLPIVLSHHDKFDGSGYHPLRGDEIPIEARIIAVADAYDAMTSDRPYRKAMATWEAKEVLLKGAGSAFDPAVVNAFVAALQRGEMEVPALLV